MGTSLPPIGVQFRARGIEDVQAALRLLARDLGTVSQQSGAAAQAIATSGTATGLAFTNAGGGLTAFGKKALTSTNAVAFSLSQLAAQGQVSFRSLATSAAGFASFFGVKGAIGAGILSLGLVLADFWSRQRREMQQTKNLADRLLEEGLARDKDKNPVGFAEAELATIRKGVADAQQRLTASRTEMVSTGPEGQLIPKFGLAGDPKLLAERNRLMTAELAALRALNDARTKTAEAGAKAADAEVDALVRVLTTGKATNAERERANTILGQSRFALDALTRSGRIDAGATADRAALLGRIKALTDALTASEIELREERSKVVRELVAANKEDQVSAFWLSTLQRLESELTRELQRSNLALSERLDLESQLRDVQAIRARTAATLAPVPTPRAGMAATADTSPEGMRRLMNAKLAAGQTPAWQRELDAQALAFETQLTQTLAGAISAAIVNGFTVGIQSGSLSEGLGAMLGTITSGLGAILMQIGQKVIASSTLLQSAVTAIMSMNPVAALAAGVALVALGSALGGRGGRAGSGGSGGSSSVGGGGYDSIRSFIFGPNAETPLASVPKALRNTVRELRDLTMPRGLAYAGAVGSSPVRGPAPTYAPAPTYQVLGVNTPQGQSILGRGLSGYTERTR